MISARDYLLATLDDGRPHSRAEMAEDLGVEVNTIEQAASRLRRRGVPVVAIGECYWMVRHCVVCGRRVSRYSRTGLCTDHERVPSSRRHHLALPL